MRVEMTQLHSAYSFHQNWAKTFFLSFSQLVLVLELAFHAHACACMCLWRCASASHSTPCSLIPQETYTPGTPGSRAAIKALPYQVALQSVHTVITFVLT